MCSRPWTHHDTECFVDYHDNGQVGSKMKCCESERRSYNKFVLMDDSHQRDARHSHQRSHRREDRSVAETAQCVCTILFYLNLPRTLTHNLKSTEMPRARIPTRSSILPKKCTRSNTGLGLRRCPQPTTEITWSTELPASEMIPDSQFRKRQGIDAASNGAPLVEFLLHR